MTARQRVLVLSAIGRNWAGHEIVDRALKEALAQGVPNGVELYHEYFDVERFSEPLALSALHTFLRAKYAAAPPDLIFAFGVEACEFIARAGPTLFPRAPVVFFATYCSIADGAVENRGFTGILASLDFSTTIDLALELQPDTRQVHVICGTSPFDRSFEALARRDFARYQDRLEFVYHCSVPMARMERELALLPARSIVFFAMMTQDSLGEAFGRIDAVARINAAASVPVYGWFETFLEHVVAARTYDLDALVRQAAQLAVQVLHGVAPADIPLQTAAPHRTLINARELRRRHIDQRRVPEGSTILFTEPDPWREYRWYMLGTLLALAVQAGFIGALLAQRARRQRAERGMKQSQTALHRSYRQVRQLARRLITAQEQERARIARELHDDVNQQVAALAISLSEVRRLLPESGTAVHAEVRRLQSQTNVLVETVRGLSHELHPNTLRHAGLRSALRGLCRETGLRLGLHVRLRCSDDIDDLHDDVALTLFRVAQEALQNVARHAQARRTRVCLERRGLQVELRIHDDGQGFATQPAPTVGLGLTSMRERVRLAGGRLRIESRPEHGTCVRVRVPLRLRNQDAAHNPANRPAASAHHNASPPHRLVRRPHRNPLTSAAQRIRMEIPPVPAPVNSPSRLPPDGQQERALP